MIIFLSIIGPLGSQTLVEAIETKAKEIWRPKPFLVSNSTPSKFRLRKPPFYKSKTVMDESKRKLSFAEIHPRISFLRVLNQ